MNDQNTEIVNTENTVIQTKNARATPTGATCARMRAQKISMFATRNR
jgi:hypothetical protein